MSQEEAQERGFLGTAGGGLLGAWLGKLLLKRLGLILRSGVFVEKPKRYCVKLPWGTTVEHAHSKGFRHSL